MLAQDQRSEYSIYIYKDYFFEEYFKAEIMMNTIMNFHLCTYTYLQRFKEYAGFKILEFKGALQS